MLNDLVVPLSSLVLPWWGCFVLSAWRVPLTMPKAFSSACVSVSNIDVLIFAFFFVVLWDIYSVLFAISQGLSCSVICLEYGVAGCLSRLWCFIWRGIKIPYSYRVVFVVKNMLTGVFGWGYKALRFY